MNWKKWTIIALTCLYNTNNHSQSHDTIKSLDLSHDLIVPCDWLCGMLLTMHGIFEWNCTIVKHIHKISLIISKLNALRRQRNGWHFNGIIKCLNKHDSNFLTVCSYGSSCHQAVLILSMVCCWIGNTPLPEQMLSQFDDCYLGSLLLNYLSIPKLQWCNRCKFRNGWVISSHTLLCMWFLAATKQLYEWFSPSVCLSVCLSVRLSVRLSVTPFWLCSHHPIIMKFSGVITSDKSDVHAKGQGQRSRSQRSQPNLTVSGL